MDEDTEHFDNIENSSVKEINYPELEGEVFISNNV